MTLIKTCLISCAAAIGLIGASATTPALTDINRLSFVNLQNNSTISISYTSSGCFHHESGVMTFSPETISYQGETKTVNFEDMAGLDKYFRNLSAKQDKVGGCTSSTNMTLTLIENGKPVGNMTLRDDFCFHSDKDMKSPNSIKYKLFEQEEVEQISLKPE